MSKQIAFPGELESELSILQGGADRHRAGTAGLMAAKNEIVEEPPPPKPPEPKPDDKPKVQATLRIP